jgi:hypothetical protein
LDADGVAHDSPYQNIRWDRHFFIAGPIESRKNQNFIVQIAQEVPDAEFVFAGQLNQAEPWYCAEFKRLIAESSNCRWVGHLPMKAQMNHIIFADAVLNSSWFEVFSLTNLHGYTLGTPIVSAMHSHDLELLQEGVIRYDPEEAADLLAALDKIPARWPDGLTEEAPINFDFLSQSWTGFDEFMKYVQKRHAEWK